MYYCRKRVWKKHSSVFSCLSLLFLAVVLAGCGISNNGSIADAQTPAPPQVLTFPDIGVTDITSLDPALGFDMNTSIVMNMLYSGLLRLDNNAQAIADQATWKISPDGKVYTFMLKPGITFSDGTPVTAESYVYTWTRALSPNRDSSFALSLEEPIVGATAVSNGDARTLAGLKALDAHTLQVTLNSPAPFFLTALTNPLFFPLNQQVIERYGDQNWTRHIVNAGIGTGPFKVEAWQHNISIKLTPNSHYYGAKTQLQLVNISFVADPQTVSYSAGQYDFTWSLSPNDQIAQKNAPSFKKTSLWQTALLFFDTSSPPFDQAAVRQAFAQAIDKKALLQSVFNDAFLPAATILPAGTPGYQADYPGLGYDPNNARALLSSVYPDTSTMPEITFSYPVSLLPRSAAISLRQMWENVLGIQMYLSSVEPNAYQQEADDHQIQFGFNLWTADFPDPYNVLATNLLSSSPENEGQWHNSQFDALVTQAEAQTGSSRLALYNQAEQLAISDVGVLPLYHPTFAALIPSWLHGVSLNGNGLYFGDWSDVSISAHSKR
jgi:ABC-type oligopeptide transport system substrate-binding subunit